MSRHSKTGRVRVKEKPVPCSICGKTPKIIDNISDVSVLCADHFAVSDDTEEEAVHLWNRLNSVNDENTKRENT